MAVKWEYGHDTGDILCAIDNAMSYVSSAMDEMEGIGELFDDHSSAKDVLDALEQRKAVYEDRMNAEYQAQRMDEARGYYREVL